MSPQFQLARRNLAGRYAVSLKRNHVAPEPILPPGLEKGKAAALCCSVVFIDMSCLFRYNQDIQCKEEEFPTGKPLREGAAGVSVCGFGGIVALEQPG